MKTKRAGYLGWQDGCAIKILCTRPTPYGKVYLCQVVDPKDGATWLEGMSEKQMIDVRVSFDEEGPNKKLFKKVRRVR